MKKPQNPNCSRCGKPSGLVTDGPLTVRLCQNCLDTWRGSKQRAIILNLVGDFLGRDHPTGG